jgi:phenylalanyl-tRNA synthetase alpha chain
MRRGGRRQVHISTNLQDYDLTDPTCNVSPSIASKLGVQLHRQPNHPLHIITQTIHEYFRGLPAEGEEEEQKGSNSNDNNNGFGLYDDLSPMVTTRAAFDSLRIPADHPSRAKTDTYYLSPNVVLRPHTSAHQVDLLTEDGSSSGSSRFLVAGDVYRRDEIDKSHYPVFHQMEGVQLFRQSDPDFVQRHLQQTLEGLARHLFGPDIAMRWVDAYFPFTHPSLELEIYYDNAWMEVLGCGVIHPQILMNAGRISSLDDTSTTGWAFGLGLERLAMVLFNIPDIRLFWSRDDRFLSQFQSGKIVTFQPYSKFPPVYKDVSFWLPRTGGTAANGDGSGAAVATAAAAFHANDVYEVIRNVGGDWIEQVSLLDEFVHPKSGRVSHCYRVTWRSMDRSLTNEEIDALQEKVREQVSKELGAELR